MAGLRYTQGGVPGIYTRVVYRAYTTRVYLRVYTTHLGYTSGCTIPTLGHTGRQATHLRAYREAGYPPRVYHRVYHNRVYHRVHHNRVYLRVYILGYTSGCI